MKKALTIALTFLLLLLLVMPTYAKRMDSLDELLAPYQAMIDKLNEELGSAIYIPEKNKVKVYQNIKDKTPKEVEEMLRKQYQDYIADDSPNSGGIHEKDDMTEDPMPSGDPYDFKVIWTGQPESAEEAVQSAH
jgi:hypothetical protein